MKLGSPATDISTQPVFSHRSSLARGLGWGLAALCMVAGVAKFILWLARQKAPISLQSWIDGPGWTLVLLFFFPVVGAMIIGRQSANRIGWLLMLPAFAAIIPYESLVPSSPPAVITPGLWFLLWFGGAAWVPIIFSIFLIPLHFPTGYPPSRRWAWVNGLAIGMALFFYGFGAFVEKFGFSDSWTVPNPIGLYPDSILGDSFWFAWGVGLSVIVFASMASLFVRYRRAQAVERQQIKWLLYAAACFALIYSLTYFASLGENLTTLESISMVCGVLAFPVAIAIAILRYRLFDIDLIIRRTLVYSLLTGFLAFAYFASISLLQRLFAIFSSRQSTLSIVLSTLAIAALFTPLRQRIQDFIDRRFYRRKYDSERILAAFAVAARSQAELTELSDCLVQVVHDTVQPDRVILWIRPGERRGSP